MGPDLPSAGHAYSKKILGDLSPSAEMPATDLREWLHCSAIQAMLDSLHWGSLLERSRVAEVIKTRSVEDYARTSAC
jgi:hypothetical protein